MDTKKLPFNNPFAELKQRLSKGAIAPNLSEPAPAVPQELPPASQTNHDNEAELFARAMQGVCGFNVRGGRVIPRHDEIAPYIPVDEELEVMARLAELVSGEENISLSWFKDFVRGANNKVNPQLMHLLEQGRFPVQDYIDLHGLSAEEALSQVEIFFKQSRAKGLRHVLIVHGKGKGSRGGESILKETLSRCLCHKRFARWVLAFSNARQKDGGTGAMYVLLKTWQGPTIFTSPQKSK